MPDAAPGTKPDAATTTTPDAAAATVPDAAAAPAPDAEAPPSPASATDAGTDQCPRDMVFVPGGRFMMGNNAGEPNQKPEHEVTVKDFCIMREHVGDRGFRRCAEIGKCTCPQRKASPQSCYVPAWCRIKRCRHPIHDSPATSRWKYAHEYCKKMIGGRLPTEEQWEHAARTRNRALWGMRSPGLSMEGGDVPREWTRSFFVDYATGKPIPVHGQRVRVVRGGIDIPRGAHHRSFTITARWAATEPDKYGFRCVVDPK